MTSALLSVSEKGPAVPDLVADADRLGPSDDAEYERLRQAARERMAAIKRAQLAAHAEEMASVRRPSAIDVTKVELNTAIDNRN